MNTDNLHIDDILKKVKRIHFIGIGGAHLPRYLFNLAIMFQVRIITIPKLSDELKKRGQKYTLVKLKKILQMMLNL